MGGKSSEQQPNSGGGSMWNGSGMMPEPAGGPPNSTAPYQPGQQGMYKDWQAQEQATQDWRPTPSRSHGQEIDNINPSWYEGERPATQSFDQYRGEQGGGFAPSWMNQNTGVNGGNMPQWGKFKAPPRDFKPPQTPAAEDGYGQGEPPQDSELQGQLKNTMATARANALRGG